MVRSTGAARHTNPSANPSGSGSTTRHGRFNALDRINDGKLSRSEYGALHSSARGSAGSGRPEGGGTSSTTK